MVMVILEVKMMVVPVMRVLELPWTRIPFYEQVALGQKPGTLLSTKIAGKWMFFPPKCGINWNHRF